MGKRADFSGWATRNGLKCSDGRVIMRDAFKQDDGVTVPLVWNHQHGEVSNVLGHAMLENREDGVYAYGFFNDSEAGNNAKKLVQHGDIVSLSIYANNLKQRGAEVLHGAIREVSLVLAGANPGAMIENVSFAHGDGFYDDEAYIWTGMELELKHSDEYEEDDYEYEEDDFEEEQPDEEEIYEEDSEMGEELNHSEESDETIADVLKTFNEKQTKVLYAIVGQAVEDAKNGKEDNEMSHNLFSQEVDAMEQEALIHSALGTVIDDAKRCGSLKESFLQHAEELQTYGIKDIDWLFPDAKNLTDKPGFIKRNPDAWVDVVMNGVHHTPFARIKMMFADLREDDARAKGYAQKAKLKKEEVFGLIKRKVEPTTIYKKQKLDRDDIIDITDFDVVSWLKAEMRMMLDEEIARAIVFGDGRSTLSDDKISETNIIPIVSDAPLYTIPYTVTPASGEELGHAIINGAVKGQDAYEGSGNTIFFTANTTVTDMLLLEDKDGHRMYKDVSELALAMSVNRIVKVPASIIPAGIYGVIVDLNDYNVGADKGGAVRMFDDFDIDYNQEKYLIETRCSGALTKPFSAVVLKAASAG